MGRVVLGSLRRCVKARDLGEAHAVGHKPRKTEGLEGRGHPLSAAFPTCVFVSRGLVERGDSKERLCLRFCRIYLLQFDME